MRYKNKDAKTPLEALVLLNEQGLVSFKSSAILADLQALAHRQTDLAATKTMQVAKQALSASFEPKNRHA